MSTNTNSVQHRLGYFQRILQAIGSQHRFTSIGSMAATVTHFSVSELQPSMTFTEDKQDVLRYLKPKSHLAPEDIDQGSGLDDP